MASSRSSVGASSSTSEKSWSSQPTSSGAYEEKAGPRSGCCVIGGYECAVGACGIGACVVGACVDGSVMVGFGSRRSGV